MSQAAVNDRLTREIEHFEAHYAQEAAQGIEPLSDFDQRRYTNPPANTIYPREFYHHLLAPLTGKDVCEIASGNGIDASICCHNGANLHAYDISSESIKMVRQRAQVNGVSQRLTTQVTGDFMQAFEGQTFDHIIGYAALHHIPMEGLAQQVYDRLKPGGSAVFAEPVINSQLLYRIRKMVPYSFFEDTDDETPLNDGDITAFSKPFDRINKRYFHLSSRIWHAFPNCWPLVKALHAIDREVLRLPFMRRFATVCVFALHRDK
jgi:2-polyprenyl-3-methyl-5-hydroxy-6-metoxy-1,4-benzoquinol methylase